MAKPEAEKPKKAPRKSAKVADLEVLTQKLLEKNITIADIGKIADQVAALIVPETKDRGAIDTSAILLKIEAILALVRGEDLGEWARAKIGLG